MTDESKSTRQYLTHRENQRERILDVAERLFITRGIDRVSLSDIAREAHITRNTVYEYFPNKEEVAWAIFQKMVESRQTIGDEPGLPVGSGFERLERALLQLPAQLELNPESWRFIVEFNTMYSREGNPDRVTQIVRQRFAGAPFLFADLIREGIADDSIRADLNPELLSAAISNLTNALNSRFALLGPLIAQEYAHPAGDIYQEICRAFLRGIRPTSTLQEQER